jgi:hypothetical protein
METNESIEQVFDNLDKNIVYKTKNSVFIGILLVLTGIASLIFYATNEFETENISSQLLFVLGMILFVLGLIKFFNRKSYYVSAENHNKIQSFQIYFNLTEREKLVRILQSKNYSELNQLAPSITDSLKIRVMATKDGQICFVQAIAFISYEYVHVTSPQELSVSEYQILEELIKSRK